MVGSKTSYVPRYLFYILHGFFCATNFRSTARTVSPVMQWHQVSWVGLTGVRYSLRKRVFGHCQVLDRVFLISVSGIHRALLGTPSGREKSLTHRLSWSSLCVKGEDIASVSFQCV